MEVVNQNLKFIRKQKKMTQQEFADFLDIKRSALGSYEEGRAKPPYEVLSVISEKFGISIDRLYKEDLSAIADDSIFGAENAKNNRPPAPIKAEKIANLDTSKLRVLAITVDKDNNENIELVPEKAAATYLQGFENPQYIKGLPKFRLPFLPAGTYRAFEIRGDSMLPLPSGSIVVGEYVENLSDVKTDQTYIVVSKTEGVVYKRLTNTMTENGKIICRSDNPSYPPFSINADDIAELWKSKSFITKDAPSGQSEFSLEKLMSTVIELQKEVFKLKDRVNK